MTTKLTSITPKHDHDDCRFVVGDAFYAAKCHGDDVWNVQHVTRYGDLTPANPSSSEMTEMLDAYHAHLERTRPE
jgi:hypothetical protein